MKVALTILGYVVAIGVIFWVYKKLHEGEKIAKCPKGDKPKADQNSHAEVCAPATTAVRKHEGCSECHSKKTKNNYEVTKEIVPIALVLATAIAASFAAYYTGSQAGIARDTAKKQLRAYIGIERLEVNAPNLSNAQYRLLPDANGIIFYADFITGVLHNYGQTPAFKVSFKVAFAKVIPMFASLPENFAYPMEPAVIASYESMATVEPGQSFRSNIGIKKPEIMVILREAQARSSYVYFYGFSKYTDIYGRQWRQKFCWAYEPWRPEGDRFTPYKEHNEEEEITQ